MSFNDDYDYDYEGDRCKFCNKPAVCAVRGDDGDEPACDNCCTHGCDVGCFDLDDADDIRTLSEVS